MNKKNKLIIATSLMSLFAVAGVTVGVTYALFTSKGKASVHINAGNLEVKFLLTNLKYDQLDPDTGLILKEQTVVLDEAYPSCYDSTLGGVDLALLGDTAIEVDKFYPTMKGLATFKVINNSDIAIQASLEKTLSGKFADTSGKSYTDMLEEDLAHLETSFKWFNEDGSATIDEEKVTIANKPSEEHEHENSRNALLSFEFLNSDEDGSIDNFFQCCSFYIDTFLTATQVTRG